MKGKSWVFSGKIYFKLPYGEFNKYDFPQRTRLFDPQKKAWVVDLNLAGCSVNERFEKYKAAEVLQHKYLQYLTPEGRHLANAVLFAFKKDKPYEFYLQGKTFYFSTIHGTALFWTAARLLKRQGSVFWAKVPSEEFSNFISALPMELKTEITNEVRRKLILPANSELLHFQNEIRARYPFLFDFQVHGASFLAYKRRAILADTMGVGKTIQGLCAGDFLMARGQAKRIVVITPSAVKSEWFFHATSPRFLGKRKEEVVVLEGNPQLRKKMLKMANAKIYIINFELVLKDFQELKKVCQDAFIIIDEASRLKNRKSKTFRIIRSLLKNAAGAAALTGTPVENGPEDFFAIAQLLGLDIKTKTWREFKFNYCITKPYLITGKRKSFYIDLIVGYKNLSFFRKELDPYFLRRNYREVADFLPEVRVVNLEVPLDSIQKRAEDILFRYMYLLFKKEKQQLGEHVAEQNILSRIAIASLVEDSPVLLSHSASELAKKIWGFIKKSIPQDYTSPKEAELLSALFQIETPVLIFTKYSTMARRLYRLLKERLKGRDVFVVTGDTTNARKNKLIETFKNSTSGVLVATDTLAFGKNIQGASAVINFDLLWNPQKLEQRIARIRRLSSRKERLYAINLVSEGIETLVVKTLEYKLAIFAELVESPTERKKSSSNLREAFKNYLIKRERKKITRKGG